MVTYTDEQLRAVLWEAFVRHGGPWGAGRDLALCVDADGNIVQTIIVPDESWWFSVDPIPGLAPNVVSVVGYPGCPTHFGGWRSWWTMRSILDAAPEGMRQRARDAAMHHELCHNAAAPPKPAAGKQREGEP